MIIAYQVILLFIIVISFIGIFAESEDKKLKDKMLGVHFACLFSFIISVMWL